MVDTTKEKESIRHAQDLAATSRERAPEELPTVESPRKAEDNLEVESWITKIEKRFARIPKGAPGPQDDQVVVQAFDPAQAKQPPVKLPITKQQMVAGQNAPMETGLRWLVTWAIRQIRMLTKIGRKVELKDIPEVKE